jgi:hypothetical protein
MMQPQLVRRASNSRGVEQSSIFGTAARTHALAASDAELD